MRSATLLIAALAACVSIAAAPAPPAPRWVGTWASAQQIPEPRNALAPDDLRDATVRQIVHVSIGGSRLRVRFSNAFGTAPLRIDAAHVARAASPAAPATIAGSDRVLRFNGRPDVVIPAGADYWSDPVDLPVPPLSSLAVSIHLPDPPQQQTSHPGSRATSYLVHGDHSADPDLPAAKAIEHWFQLAGVEVEAPKQARAIVTLGDSITDGHGATTNGDDRWPDQLARRLQADPRTRGIAVLNQGIGGNRLLEDGLGPNALARFDRDVLSQAGVHTVILLEGINDLGTFANSRQADEATHRAFTQSLIGAYRQIIDRAHAHGIRVIGATITPDTGSTYYHPDAQSEADRQAVNLWIRTRGHFDAVVDFDAAVRDPAAPAQFQPAFDSGDHLHPSPAGYRAMAAAIPLDLFADDRSPVRTPR